MEALILTEGGNDIGYGHFTRCIALSQAFKERGIQTQIAIKTIDNIDSAVSGQNYQILDWLKEKEKLSEIAEGKDIIIIDSYLADISIYDMIAKLAKVPVYIDDTKKLEYPKGIILNCSLYAEELYSSRKKNNEYLFGSKYIMLRKPFWNVAIKKIDKNIHSVMITFGGTDFNNMTPKILKFLNDFYPELHKTVVIGKGFKNVKDIEERAGRFTELVYSATAEKMKKIMLAADIAISSGGQTMYELLRTGTPVLGICVADNQKLGLEKLQEMKLVKYAGSYDEDKLEDKIKKTISSLEDQNKRKMISKRSRKAIDGHGPKRVVGQILDYS